MNVGVCVSGHNLQACIYSIPFLEVACYSCISCWTTWGCRLWTRRCLLQHHSEHCQNAIFSETFENLNATTLHTGGQEIHKLMQPLTAGFRWTWQLHRKLRSWQMKSLSHMPRICKCCTHRPFVRLSNGLPCHWASRCQSPRAVELGSSPEASLLGPLVGLLLAQSLAWPPCASSADWCL